MTFRTILLVLGWVLLSMVAAAARTITVDDSGGANYRTIQEAVNAASDGDLIQVASGTYREQVIVSDKRISIKGAGSALTTIQNRDIVVAYLDGASGTIEGLKLRSFGSAPGAALLIVNSSPEVKDNDISGASGAGVEIKGGRPTLEGNYVHGNKGSGVFVHGSARVELSENNISHNGVNGNLPGVEVRDSAQATLEYNRIWINSGSAVFVHNNGRVTMTGNSLVGNGLHGIVAGNNAQATLKANSMWWNGQLGVWLKEARSATLDGNFISYQRLGYLTDQRAQVSRQVNNLFMQNLADVSGSGLTPQDATVCTNIYVHPQFSNLLRGLEEVGDLVKSLRQRESATTTRQLLSKVQDLELIGADFYRETNLRDIARHRLNLVIALNPNSTAASRARSQLRTL